MRTKLLISAIALLALTAWRDAAPEWPVAGPMPDEPGHAARSTYEAITYEAINAGARSYLPVDPMPWGDVNRRVAPKAVLAYLSRYTHRVAISNRRIIAADGQSVTFKVKDYRVEGPGRYTTMTLGTHEFIRRFLIHVLPRGLHRIRHYGLFANSARADNLAKMRELLAVAAPEIEDETGVDPGTIDARSWPCPCCGGRRIVIEKPSPMPTVIRIATS